MQYALIDSKKSYVRYISHELRTPLRREMKQKRWMEMRRKVAEEGMKEGKEEGRQEVRKYKR